MTATRPAPLTLDQADVLVAAMSDTPLSTAIRVLIATWRERASAGDMSPQTVDKFTLLMGRFDRYAYATGALICADVTPDLVSDFIRAHGRDRQGNEAPPSVSTQHQRRSVIRLWARDAIVAGYLLADPTLHLDLPPRSRSLTRPVTDDEVALIEYQAESWATHTRHAATVALALSGVHSGEIASIRPGDVRDGLIAAPGTVRVQARTLSIASPWCRRVLTERVDLVGGADGGRTLVSTGKGTDAQQQARACTAIRDVIIRAGLDTDPAIKPSSLTAHPARAVFDRTGRIQDSARLLGVTSLDAAASAIDWDWQAAP
ncbi:site-specific tyrosine recombinase XerC [Dermacoccus nishinomiyaensis]|uniref:tyrosine-type recombinase/integrase n=2 Tax=Dermacoccaceae TaxID=145357 RepID=UPI0002EF6B15|nr:hypothetical protein [Dermacoccus nishinomiyaensis]STD71424.1 site-specific tyrosine recombinase XerC [Dermacoccus nishinomiyaensis]